MLEITQIPVLNDNYIYLINDTVMNVTAAVDPAVATTVLKRLAEQDWQLDYILNTHHHSDHVGANHELKDKTGCIIIGAEKDKKRIPCIDQTVVEGDTIAIGQHHAAVLEVPGHTSAHIAFWFEKEDTLFCGDTLFSLGCGRLFEGTPGQMWYSLQKIRRLPEQTRICCAHEYTESNARFAIHLEPENTQLKDVMRKIHQRRALNQPTVPSRLTLEKQFNPFLRVDDSAFQDAIGMGNTDPVCVFAKIRRLKDNFRG